MLGHLLFAQVNCFQVLAVGSILVYTSLVDLSVQLVTCGGPWTISSGHVMS